MVSKCICLNDFHRLKLFQACFLCDFVFAFVCVVLEVSHVGDVADVAYFISKVLEQFEEYVICYARSGMSEVCVSINGRATDVHADVSGVYRDEEFFLM